MRKKEEWGVEVKKQTEKCDLMNGILADVDKRVKRIDRWGKKKER